MIIPLVHVNGTDKQTLLDLRFEVLQHLRTTLNAFYNMAPHPRDYYLQVSKHFESAIEQHNHRVTIVSALIDEMRKEIEAIDQVR